MRRWLTWSILALILIAVAVLAASSVRLDSATADEGAHIASGYLKLRHGWLDFYADQPALCDTLNALPLRGYDFPPVSGNPWEVGHQFLHESGFDVNRLLWLARLPSIAMLLALCVAVFLFVRRWSRSDAWALVAAALTGFCPNILAHGRLATPDIQVTLFVFVAAALCLEMFEKPRAITAIALGVAVALAVLVKLSGLIIGPYLALLFLFRLRKNLVKPIAIAVAAALITFIAAYAIVAGPDYLHATNSSRLTVAFHAYAKHIATVRYWYSGESGQVQYLNGQFSTKGWPHYYLAALGLKVPIGAQILFLAAVVLAFRKKAPFALRACLLFIAVFFVALARSDLDLGVRYALPLLPFAFSAIGLALAQVKSRAAMIGAGVLVAWHVTASVLAYPGYISYFNEFVRDQRAKDLYLIDSNLDWGQDLRRLDLWCREHNVDAITVNYFGAGEPTRELHARVTTWPGPNGPPPPKGWFALSRHLYRLTFFPQMSPVSYATYLANSHARYVTTVGGSIDVYRVE